MMGAVWITLRGSEKLRPPSREVVSTILPLSAHTTYRVPSRPTAPAKPSSAPLSSRGSPRRLSISTGCDQLLPASVERENRISESATVQRVQPTYRLPKQGLEELLSATIYGLAS